LLAQLIEVLLQTAEKGVLRLLAHVDPYMPLLARLYAGMA